MEFLNFLQDALKEIEPKDRETKEVIKEAFEKLLIILSPICPHIAEELWHELGNESFISLETFPEWDKELIKEDTFTLLVQMNGKLRDHVEAPLNINKEEAIALVKDNADLIEGRVNGVKIQILTKFLKKS